MTHVLLATTVESGNRRFRARIVLREVFFASIFFVRQGLPAKCKSVRGGSVHNVGVDRDAGLTLIFNVGCSMPYFSVKKDGGA